MIINLQNVSKHYQLGDNSVPVLDKLSMQVATGSRIAIVGPSGSGKSTLLLLLVGLEECNSGSVEIDGQRLEKLGADEKADLRKEAIGIVFQSFHLINTLSALDNVALPLEINGSRESRARALAMLEKVGLSDRADHYPTQLSGGEQQRVAIARALVHRPKIVVADEPTGNLDEQTGNTIIDLLFNLNQELDTTLILVTHDLTLANRCDRTLKLQEGKLVESLHKEQPITES